MKNAKPLLIAAGVTFVAGLGFYLWKNRDAMREAARRRSQNAAVDELSENLSREFRAAIDIDPPGVT